MNTYLDSVCNKCGHISTKKDPRPYHRCTICSEPYLLSSKKEPTVLPVIQKESKISALIVRLVGMFLIVFMLIWILSLYYLAFEKFPAYKELNSMQGDLTSVSECITVGSRKRKRSYHKISVSNADNTKVFKVPCYQGFKDLMGSDLVDLESLIVYHGETGSLFSPKNRVFNLKVNGETYISYEQLEESSHKAKNYSFWKANFLVLFMVSYCFFLYRRNLTSQARRTL
jgi:hypothetical protein